MHEAYFNPARPLENELSVGVRDGFTLACVGDCIISRPLSELAAHDSDFAAVAALLRSADLACGNLETTIVDMDGFGGAPYSWDGDWPLTSEPAVAGDLAALGVRLVARANNHVLDWGLEGMRETSARLKRASIAFAGVGEHQGQARTAAYAETAKGRVGLVSFATTYRPTTDALAAYGACPGRPGLSGLELRKVTVVPAEVFGQLEDIHRKLDGQSAGRVQGGTLSLFGQSFERGDAFQYRYEPAAHDLKQILQNIRLGKQHADALVVAVHAHESTNDAFPQLPARFLTQLARDCIDAGADVFMVSGIHHLGPIEIYRGRPILYGLANFFWSDIQQPLPEELYRKNEALVAAAFEQPDRVTDADLANLMNAQSFASHLPFESLLVTSHFEAGRITELRLHPLDLGYGAPLTRSGVPRRASDELGARILQRVQDVSAAFGSNVQIDITDGIGIVRL
jgi:poly-gamma-glutamate capsule biosynthesis protein CapA/YwtB (metallophosphatase superfamily)